MCVLEEQRLVGDERLHLVVEDPVVDALMLLAAQHVVMHQLLRLHRLAVLHVMEHCRQFQFLLEI